jgi:aryl-alcohol dehydrogenase-like predicted oxidoreductase
VRIALGTAQFGMPYGIANAVGRVQPDECAAILALGSANGVDTIDTAIAYGDSERVLGEVGVGPFRVVTKLPAVPDDVKDTGAWVERMVASSLRRLRTDRLFAVLLHRPAQLLDSRGDALYHALCDLKAQGLSSCIGISIYGPEELEVTSSRYPLDIVQAPLNVFDRRLERSGWLQKLAASGVEVHLRSVFLQGLLITSELPAAFAPWRSLHERWSGWTQAAGVTRVQACVQYALSVSGVARVVVGVDSIAHLRQILDAATAACPIPPDDISTTDLDLIDPSRWAGLTGPDARSPTPPVH